jgi:hypothetical protein
MQVHQTARSHTFAALNHASAIIVLSNQRDLEHHPKVGASWKCSRPCVRTRHTSGPPTTAQRWTCCSSNAAAASESNANERTLLRSPRPFKSP